MQPKITVEGNCIVGEYEPGNGTRYTAIAVPWTNGRDRSMGIMGCVSNGWLVVSGNSGQAYLFQKDGPLIDNYLIKKLGGYPGDYPYFGDLIRTLIMRPDTTGHFAVGNRYVHEG